MGRGISGFGKGSVRSGVSPAAKVLTINGETIESLVAPYVGQYKYVGIRTQWESFELGDVTHQSSVWIDGTETSKKLSGISVTSVKSNAVVAHSDQKGGYSIMRQYANSGTYLGDHVAIIVSNTATRGHDYGELILRDAKVVKILK